MHSVRYVDEGALPSGHCWAMVRVGDDYVWFLKRGVTCSAVLENAWEAFVQLSSAREDAA